jgi:hypothetical protein
MENSLVSLDYRYHCQDEKNRLIFRYDSTPHFPALSSFPHHKHLPDEVIACKKPNLEQVLQEAMAVMKQVISTIALLRMRSRYQYEYLE